MPIFRSSIHDLPKKPGLLLLVFAAGLAISVAHISIAQEIESFPKSQQPLHGDVKNGKRLYDNYGCYECHGGQGQGSTLSGPRIGPDPMQFSSFVRYIRRPTGQMPPYSAKITTDAELTDIYAFLQSLPQPPDAKKIPTLTPATTEKKR